MTINFTFKQVLEYVKREDPDNAGTLDKLLGVSLLGAAAGAAIIHSPYAVALLPFITPKNELVKVMKDKINLWGKRKDDDFLKRQTRMQMAYGLMCYTAFFEAVDRSVPDDLRSQIALTDSEKLWIARGGKANVQTSDDLATLEDEGPLADQITFPHPTETLGEQQRRISVLYKALGEVYRDFVGKLAFWDRLKENQREQFNAAVHSALDLAGRLFEAQYLELAQQFEDFSVWANLQEHKKARAALGQISEDVRRYGEIAAASKDAVDVGFKKLNEAVLAIPESLETAKAERIDEVLRKHYSAGIQGPIFKDAEASAGDAQLQFPKVSEAFIPQAYRVLRHDPTISRLEDDKTWADLPSRDDIGPFLLSYLSSPYATELPLVILGHPGGGKSLLTLVFSAQIMPHYTVIRVPLREVNSDASIVGQIEEYVSELTLTPDPWVRISSSLKSKPIVVILDGYDELLQASGKVFSHYLRDVQEFQQHETERRSPVRVIVTSRITLIDKATIPPGSTILRLLDFDETRRIRWVNIWNKANAKYFRDARVERFSLPREGDPRAAQISSLAGQPLLLLMLTLYDAERNELRNSGSLDRTALYESLLRRFIIRERSKEPAFERDLTPKEQGEEIDREMARLGVAALGMFNRNKLHVLSTELSRDLALFRLEQQVRSDGVGRRQLSQADMLLGSFFFVYRSQAQTGGASDQHQVNAAFEFLHNTFGEFLAAHFIVTTLLKLVGVLTSMEENPQLRQQAAEFFEELDRVNEGRFLLICLAFSPFYTRPAIMEMIQEWTAHALDERNIGRHHFLDCLDRILIKQIGQILTKQRMPSLFQGETAPSVPVMDQPLLGYLAIYSLNLFLLRAAVDPDPFVFAENAVVQRQDGVRPWDQLVNLWRSWFSVESLAGVVAVIQAQRTRGEIEIRYARGLGASIGGLKLTLIHEVGKALGDDLTAGLSGFLIEESGELGPPEVDVNAWAERLKEERVDLAFGSFYRRWASQLVATVLFSKDQEMEMFSGLSVHLNRALSDLTATGSTYKLFQVFSVVRAYSAKTNGDEAIWYILFQHFLDMGVLPGIALRAPGLFVELADRQIRYSDRFTGSTLERTPPDFFQRILGSRSRRNILYRFNMMYSHSKPLTELMEDRRDIALKLFMAVFRSGETTIEKLMRLANPSAVNKFLESVTDTYWTNGGVDIALVNKVKHSL